MPLLNKKKIEGRILLRSALILILLTELAFFYFLPKFKSQQPEASSFKNVQPGEVTLSTSLKSTTATLGTAVDVSKSMVINTVSTKATLFDGAMVTCELSSPTQVLVGRYTTGTATDNKFRVVEFQGDDARVQHGYSKIHTSVGSRTVAFPYSVDMNKTFILSSTAMTVNESGNDFSDCFIGAELIDNNTIEFSRYYINGQEAMDIAYEIIELGSDVSVQRGNNTFTGTMNNTTLTTPVDLNKSFVLASPRAAGSGVEMDDNFVTAQFVDNSTIRFTRKGTNASVEVFWQVVEFTDATTVQSGNIINTTSKTASNTTTSVDTNRTFVLYTANSAATSNDLGEVYWGVNQTGSTTISLNREDQTSGSIYWHSVELPAVKVTAPNGAQTPVWRVGQTKAINC